MATPQEMVKEFESKFRLKVNDQLTELTPEERLLRGKLMLEEVLEFFDGLGLDLYAYDRLTGHESFELTLSVTNEYDPIETADGLGDIVVIAYGTSNRMGVDLDAVVAEIHDSNMSKLDENGEPIVNGLSEGYRHAGCGVIYDEDGYDDSKPIGKILKGPNYRKPDIAKVIGLK